MPVFCPRCRTPLELTETAALAEVRCPACGSTFSRGLTHTVDWAPETAALHRSTPEQEPTLPGPGNNLRKLGKFELLEVVGTGAFGTVYKARDPELDRVVAIKVPRGADLSDSQDLDRFLREARSAAPLRHPGIVPIHEVGQADGLPFLVSDFVQGVTLAERLTAQPSALEEAVRLVAAVADALQYAHDQGVIHRDVKPANIMLDEQGRPHIMDFGLAKRTGGEAALTLEGHVLGTPTYMSPEQARGEAYKVDGRSDVYSLGVVLYELLTGAPPFRGNLRMLLLQVLRDEPRPPRSLNDKVPRDLETICLKALAKEPGRRYASAGQLADDLRRFSRGEPIQARPVGRVEKCWRWCRRNPVPAGLTAAVVGVFLLGFAGVTWQYLRAEASRAEAETHLHEANAQRARAEEGFREAVQAVNESFTLVSENKLLEVPGLQPLRRELLQAALRYYRKFIERRRNDPALRSELGAAYVRVGAITEALGSWAEARDAYRRALPILEEQARRQPDDRDAQQRLATGWNNLGDVLVSLGMRERDIKNANEVFRCMHKALAIRRRLVRTWPTIAELQQELASSYNNLGIAYNRTDQPARALRLLRQAIALRRRLVRAAPRVADQPSGRGVVLSPDELAVARRRYVADNHSGLGAALSNYGEALWRLGRVKEAEARMREAVAEQALAVQQEPRILHYRQFLANHHFNLSRLLSEQGRFKEALVALQPGRTLYETLAHENPAVAEIQFHLAGLYLRLGELEEMVGHEAEAITVFELARIVLSRPELAAVGREVDSRLAQAWYHLARLHIKAGREDQALQAYRHSRSLLRKLVRQDPSGTSLPDNLARTHAAVGDLEWNAGHRAEAVSSWQQAVDLWNRLLTRRPRNLDFKDSLAEALRKKGRAERTPGRKEDGLRSLRRAVQLREEILRADPTQKDGPRKLAEARWDLARQLTSLGRPEQAAAICDRATRDLRAALVKVPGDDALLQLLYNCCWHRAEALRASKHSAAAVGPCREACQVAEDLLRRRREDPSRLAPVSDAYRLLGRLQEDLNRPREAITAYHMVQQHGEKLVGLKPDDDEQANELASDDLRLGNLQADLGEWGPAAAALAKARRLWEKLLQCHPAAAQYQRPLAHCYNNLGAVARAAGQMEQAVRLMRLGLELRERAARARPDHAQRQFDVAASHYNLSVAYRALKRSGLALESAEVARAILETLADRNPRDSRYRQQLGWVQTQLAELHGAGQRWAPAREALHRAGRLWGQLARTEPANASTLWQWGRCYQALAGGHETADEGKQAAACWTTASGIFARGSRLYPQDADFREAQGNCLNGLGLLSKKTGGSTAAQEALQKALAVRAALVRDYPQELRYAIELGGSYCNLGHLLSKMSKPREALGWYARAARTLEGVLRQRQDPSARRYLANTYSGRTEILCRLGRFRDALADWEQFGRLTGGQDAVEYRLHRAAILAHTGDHLGAAAEAKKLKEIVKEADDLYNLACVHSLTAAAVRKDTTRTAAERDRLAGQQAAQAVDLLKRAVEKGYRDVKQLQQDADLEGLREREDYQKVLELLRQQLPRRTST